MGRPKLYENHAARQAAYAKRQRTELSTLRQLCGTVTLTEYECDLLSHLAYYLESPRGIEMDGSWLDALAQFEPGRKRNSTRRVVAEAILSRLHYVRLTIIDDDGLTTDVTDVCEDEWSNATYVMGERFDSAG
jgi:hypothetical protein